MSACPLRVRVSVAAVAALREFILLQGASKNDNTMTWDKLWTMNKKARLGATLPLPHALPTPYPPRLPTPYPPCLPAVPTPPQVIDPVCPRFTAVSEARVLVTLTNGALGGSLPTG